MEEKIEKVHASSWLEITCNCPHCNEYIDDREIDKNFSIDLREYLDDTLRAESCDVEVSCPKCKKDFIITDIDY